MYLYCKSYKLYLLMEYRIIIMSQTTTNRTISSWKFIPKHLSSPSVFSGIDVVRSIFFFEVFCIYIVVCPVVIFLLAMVLYVLRF